MGKKEGRLEIDLKLEWRQEVFKEERERERVGGERNRGRGIQGRRERWGGEREGSRN